MLTVPMPLPYRASNSSAFLGLSSTPTAALSNSGGDVLMTVPIVDQLAHLTKAKRKAVVRDAPRIIALSVLHRLPDTWFLASLVGSRMRREMEALCLVGHYAHGSGCSCGSCPSAGVAGIPKLTELLEGLPGVQKAYVPKANNFAFRYNSHPSGPVIIRFGKNRNIDSTIATTTAATSESGSKINSDETSSSAAVSAGSSDAQTTSAGAATSSDAADDKPRSFPPPPGPPLRLPVDKRGRWVLPDEEPLVTSADVMAKMLAESSLRTTSLTIGEIITAATGSGSDRVDDGNADSSGSVGAGKLSSSSSKPVPTKIHLPSGASTPTSAGGCRREGGGLASQDARNSSSGGGSGNRFAPKPPAVVRQPVGGASTQLQSGPSLPSLPSVPHSISTGLGLPNQYQHLPHLSQLQQHQSSQLQPQFGCHDYGHGHLNGPMAGVYNRRGSSHSTPRSNLFFGHTGCGSDGGTPGRRSVISAGAASSTGRGDERATPPTPSTPQLPASVFLARGVRVARGPPEASAAMTSASLSGPIASGFTGRTWPLRCSADV